MSDNFSPDEGLKKTESNRVNSSNLHTFLKANSSPELTEKWKIKLEKEEIKNSLKIESFVVCIDIRNSTKLMINALDHKVFVDFISNVVTNFKEKIIDNHGIFDKFTGDGVLCHFPIFEDKDKEKIKEKIIIFLEECNNIFSIEYKKNLDSNLFPIEYKDIGLGIGVDYGRVNYSFLNNTFYAVGVPVVYACRLSSAPAHSVYLNIGAHLKIQSKNFKKESINIKHEGLINVYSRKYNI